MIECKREAHRRERGWWVYQHLPLVDRLLDVGCFTGSQTAAWAPKARALFGVDVDPAVLVGEPAVRKCQASGSALPFADATFDAVVCSEVLEHVPEEVERPLVEELRRVINDTGTLLFTTPHKGWFAWLDPLDAKRRLGLREGKGHKHFTMNEVERLFAGLFEIDYLDRNSLLLYPLSTWLGLGNEHRLLRFRERLSDWDYQHHFGAASFNMALVARPV